MGDLGQEKPWFATRNPAKLFLAKQKAEQRPSSYAALEWYINTLAK